MGDLQHDAHTVPGLSFRILPCAVLQVLYDMKRTFHGEMAFPSIFIYYRANAAIVMFKSRGIQSPYLLIFHNHHSSCICRFYLISLDDPADKIKKVRISPFGKF